MKKHLLPLLLIAGMVIASNSFAQRKCATYEYNKALMQSNPTFSQNQKEIEKFTADFIKRGGSNSVVPLIGTPVYTIPVIVHVVYKTNAQNISDAQINSQIAVLNKDYQLKNADKSQVPSAFQSRVADFKIKFCLAKTDPNGNPTSGIRRVKTSKSSFSYLTDDVKFNSSGGDNAWPAKDYLNIWVCNLGNGLLGYATFPGGAANRDGVVILYNAFGNTGVLFPPFDKGRTATHEIGHWLNLRHIWGDDGGACNGSDLVDDTPNQGNYNFGCPSFPHKTCNNGPSGDMFMNYMDYVDDACMVMFSKGQKDRSYAVLEQGGPRHSITQSGKCNAPRIVSAGSTSADDIVASGKMVKIYPQPSNNFANIELRANWKGNTTITVMSEQGAIAKVKQVNAESKIVRLDVSALKAGTYYIRLKNGKETVTQILMVQH